MTNRTTSMNDFFKFRCCRKQFQGQRWIPKRWECNAWVILDSAMGIYHSSYPSAVSIGRAPYANQKMSVVIQFLKLYFRGIQKASSKNSGTSKSGTVFG